MYGIEMHEDGSIDTTKLLDNVLEINRKEEAASGHIVKEEPEFTENEWDELNNTAKGQDLQNNGCMTSEEMLDSLQEPTDVMNLSVSVSDEEDEKALVAFHPENHIAVCPLLKLMFTAEFSIEQSSKNTAVNVTAIDYTTSSKATGNLNDCRKMMRELIRAGSTQLTSEIMQMLFKQAVGMVVNYAVDCPSFASWNHNITGWVDGYGTSKYCGFNIADGSTLSIIKSKYCGTATDMQQAGSLRGWVAAANKYVVKKPILSCVVASTVIGILRQRYKSFDLSTQVSIGLVGATTTGKTSAIQIARTAHTTGGEITTSDSTINALVAKYAAMPTVPAQLDEAALISSARNGDKLGVLNVLMKVASGQTRGRLEPTGKMESSGKYYAPVLMTMTKSLLLNSGNDEGQASRIIEFKLGPKDLFSSDAECRSAYAKFEANRGNVAEDFALALLKEEKQKGRYEFESELKAKYEEARDRIAKKLIAPRIANMVAMIVLSAELMRQYLDINFNIQDIEDCLVKRCNELREFFNKRPVVISIEDAEKILAQYFLEHKASFCSGRITNRNELEDKYLGCYQRAGNNIVLSIPSDAYYDRLRWMLYNVSPDVIISMEKGNPVNEEVPRVALITDILDVWRDTGTLITRDKGYKKKVTLVSNEGQQPVYEIIITQKALEA